MKSNQRRFRRHGGLLVQQLILIGISGILMMLAIRFIHQTLDFASLYQKQFNSQRTLSLLARTFRGDVHSARIVKVLDESRLELKGMVGDLIIYRVDNSEVIREVWRKGDESQSMGRSSVSDSYRLSNNQSARLLIENGLVTLSVETRERGDPDSKPPLHNRFVVRAGYVPSEGQLLDDLNTEGDSNEP